jgi:hypothetical protein
MINSYGTFAFETPKNQKKPDTARVQILSEIYIYIERLELFLDLCV